MREQGWRRLTRIANDEIEKLTPNFSRCANRDEALLRQLTHAICI